MGEPDDWKIHIEDDLLPEEGTGLDDRESVVRRVEAIMDQIAAKCRDAVSGKPKKKSPNAKLLERVQKVDANVGNRRMRDRAMKTLRQAHDMLMATGIEDAGDNLYVAGGGFKADSDLLVIACHLLKKLHDGDVEGDLCMLADDVTNAILTSIQRSVSQKVEAYEKREGGPLNLNPELMLLKYMNSFMVGEEVDSVLHDVSVVLHYQNEATSIVRDFSREGFGPYVEHLAQRGKYHQTVRDRACNPGTRVHEKAGQCIIDARIKQACFVAFDEHGLPYSNDVTPQHPWADFREYRRQFFDVFKKVRESVAEKGEPLRNEAVLELEVAEQLRIIRRASVAELLRKLVNRDLDYGESQDAASTRVGLYVGDTGRCRHIRVVTRDFDNDFQQTQVPVPTLFQPVRELLEKEMTAFGKILQERYGSRYKILGPRIKELESTLLKMLKEKKTTIGSITDLIGFTVLTDTEDEAEQVYREIKDMMVPGDIKEAVTWANPTRRGYKSMDITGVPEWFNTRIQVQCRTKKLDALNFGQYSNHDAYKVFSGRELLKNINENPGEYLDLLYRALHNMRVAYHILREERFPPKERDAVVVDRRLEFRKLPELEHTCDGTPAAVLDLYSRDYHDAMSLVRTSTLYEPTPGLVDSDPIVNEDASP